MKMRQNLGHFGMKWVKAMCHTDTPLWSAREIAPIAPTTERERHAKNVWHIALR